MEVRIWGLAIHTVPFNGTNSRGGEDLGAGYFKNLKFFECFKFF